MYDKPILKRIKSSKDLTTFFKGEDENVEPVYRETIKSSISINYEREVVETREPQHPEIIVKTICSCCTIL